MDAIYKEQFLHLFLPLIMHCLTLSLSLSPTFSFETIKTCLKTVLLLKYAVEQN